MKRRERKEGKGEERQGKMRRKEIVKQLKFTKGSKPRVSSHLRY